MTLFAATVFRTLLKIIYGYAGKTEPFIDTVFVIMVLTISDL